MRPIAALLSLALLLAGGSASGPAGAAGEQQELERLRSRIEQAKRELTAAEGVRVEASDALRASESAISASSRALRELAVQVRETRSELRGLATKTRATRTELDARESQLAALLQARYFAGDRGALKLLLSGEDPNRVARGLTYYGYLSGAQAELIRDLRGRIAALAALEARARDTSAELAALERQAQAERATLLSQAAERRRVLARISGDISKQRREIDTLRSNEARLSRLVDRLARALRAAPATHASSRLRNERLPEAAARAGEFAGSKGKLRLPVRGELAGRFGAPREGASLTWKGLLILAPEGEEVRAVADGRVVFAEWMRGFGNLLILDHGEGYLTIYGNNESVLRQVGDAVHAGDVVATVGATGGAQSSGLYFEMRYQGKPFDPLSWVSLK